MECLNDAHFPPGLNSNSIVLVLKKNSLESLPNLIPMALCNVSTKLLLMSAPLGYPTSDMEEVGDEFISVRENLIS